MLRFSPTKITTDKQYVVYFSLDHVGPGIPQIESNIEQVDFSPRILALQLLMESIEHYEGSGSSTSTTNLRNQNRNWCSSTEWRNKNFNSTSGFAIERASKSRFTGWEKFSQQVLDDRLRHLHKQYFEDFLKEQSLHHVRIYQIFLNLDFISTSLVIFIQ